MNFQNLKFAYSATDTDEIRLEKLAILLLSTLCSTAGVVWALMYLVIFGWEPVVLLPVSFVVIVGSTLVYAHVSKKHYPLIYAQIICIMYVPALIQWTVGGLFDSGIVLMWGILGPICALVFFTLRRASFWYALFILNFIITIIFNDFFTANRLLVEESTQILLFVMNAGFSSSVIFLFASYYVNEAIREQHKATRLLAENIQQEIALRENEKLATLGRLSAGVAHELNNPAAAAQRGTEYLRDTILKLEEMAFSTVQSQFSDAHKHIIDRETQHILVNAKSPIEIDPLTRSDYEYEIETWLERNQIEDSWEVAPLLVSIGYNCDKLTTLEKQFTPDQFKLVVKILAYRYRTFSIIEEIGHGTSRISTIVKALKSYSYMDQAPSQAVDVHEGLDNTLIMLGSKLKRGVEVVRHYADDLPKIEAYGSELNQVWTNIIDNAISAMDGQGEIQLTTSIKDQCIIVEIKDNGPGIPDEIQQKVFDPFFTTKAPGEGTGLGLNISHNIIVQKHQGHIDIDSRPGSTRFIIALPINYTQPALDTQA